MKTAMQELIEDFEAIVGDGYRIEPHAAIELCKQLLETEKQQITDAFVSGMVEIIEVVKKKHNAEMPETTNEIELVRNGDTPEQLADYFEKALEDPAEMGEASIVHTPSPSGPRWT
jgi:dihydroorotase-like cyclic amidohydrolase